MRFTRWWNPSLPQTLSISMMLLYADAVFTVLALLGTGIGGSAYIFVAPLLFDTPTSIEALRSVETSVTLIVLVSAFAYAFAALAIANSQKIGWKVGVGVAAGAVVLPVAAGGLGFVFGSNYLITYIFNVALLAALLHPQSREHQRVWFEGPASRPGRGRKGGPRRL